MALSPKELRTAKIIGGVVGAILSLLLLVVVPMAANYRDHGSVFLKQAASAAANPNLPPALLKGGPE